MDIHVPVWLLWVCGICGTTMVIVFEIIAVFAYDIDKHGIH